MTKGSHIYSSQMKRERDWVTWVAPIPCILITVGFIVMAFGRSNAQGWFATCLYAAMWLFLVWKYSHDHG